MVVAIPVSVSYSYSHVPSHPTGSLRAGCRVWGDGLGVRRSVREAGGGKKECMNGINIERFNGFEFRCVCRLVSFS